MIRPALLLLLLTASIVRGQSSGPSARLRGESEGATTRKRLSEAQQKLQAGQAAVAADELQRILDESGDDLVLVQNNHFQPARRIVQQYLAALPPDTLNAFQNRLEEPAKKLLDAGRRDRDPAPLRQLLGRYFISRPAEEAILLLGELLFERGDFRAAEQAWRLLLPPGTANELSYPSAKTDSALVKAKLVQAAIFAGDLDRAKGDAANFKKEHPKASGRLAGTDGLFAETLAKLLANPPVLRDGHGPSGWTTFAGNPSRDGAVPEPLPRLYAGEPTWRTAFPRQLGDKRAHRPASFPAARTLAFHPVVLDSLAYVAEAGRIYSFDLKTGAARIAFDARTLADPPALSDAELALPNLLDADFTLTVHSGRLYARLGNVDLPSSTELATGKAPGSILVVLQPVNPTDQLKNSLTLKPIATLAPPVGKPGKVVWEGAPVVADGKLYAACTRIDERGRWVHAIACYDDPPSAKPNWVVDVADTDATTPRQRHEVLTLAGGNIVFALPQGLIVALDRVAGKMAWAFRSTPAAHAPPNGPQQDLCPAVYSGGRVYFAPAEGDKLHALDAETGRPVWEEGPLQVGQILGVAGNRLVVTIAGPQKGIRAYDIADGSDRGPRGWRNHDDSGLAAYGRGLLTADAVLWPTKGHLYTLSLLDGSVRGQPLANPHGNLAYANGVLLVATPTELWGYALDPTESIEPIRPRTLAPADIVPAYRSVARTVPTVELWDWPRAELALGAERILTPGSWPIQHPRADGKSILVCDGTAIWSWPTDLNKPVWKAELKTPARIVRAAFDDGYWIAWGQSSIVSVRATDGTVRWQFDTPSQEHLFEGGSFAGSRFVTCLGTRCLLALDLVTGRVAWLRDPLGRPRFREFGIVSSPRFNPHFLAVGDCVLVQKTDGERWTLSADTGRLLHTTPTCPTPWTIPPATVDGIAFVPDGAGLVVAVAPLTNRVLWRYVAEGETNLSGAAPEVRVTEDDLYVLIARNTGRELQRLDRKSGIGEWRNAAPVPGQGATLADLHSEEDRIYLIRPGGVVCLTRSVGRKLWQRELPNGGRWQGIVTAGGLLIGRTEPLPEEPVAEVFNRVLRRFAEWPTPVRALGLAMTLTRAMFSGTAIAMLLDSTTGEVASRIDAPALGPFLRIHRAGFGGVLLSTGTAHPLTASK